MNPPLEKSLNFPDSSRLMRGRYLSFDAMEEASFAGSAPSAMFVQPATRLPERNMQMRPR
jgi:hypothetical protein